MQNSQAVTSAAVDDPPQVSLSPPPSLCLYMYILVYVSVSDTYPSISYPVFL